MSLAQRPIGPLRGFLVLLFAILVLFQTVSLPGQFAHMAEEEPDQAYLRWPLTVVSVFWLLCIQVVIVSLWKLLSLIRSDRIFSSDSMDWVDAIVWAVGAAWAGLMGLAAYFVVVRGTPDDPGTPLLLLVVSVGISVLGLLMVVLRTLLQQATTLRTDMEAVI